MRRILLVITTLVIAARGVWLATASGQPACTDNWTGDAGTADWGASLAHGAKDRGGDHDDKASVAD